jgi:hypothetical protein
MILAARRHTVRNFPADDLERSLQKEFAGAAA